MRRVLALFVVVAACSSSRRAPARITFVCEHGAAKSVVAAAWFNKLAAERGLAVRAEPRGATPQAALSRPSVDGLGADGLAPGLDAPRALTGVDVVASARVVVFDCGQPAMSSVAAHDECWDDVPAVAQDYGRARDAIRAHVERLVDALAAAR